MLIFKMKTNFKKEKRSFPSLKTEDSMPSSTILAQLVFKKLVKRNPKDFKLKEVTIKDTYNYLNKLKPSKSRGDDEVNNFIIKQIPNFMAVCITHLFNHIVWKGIFPDNLKTSRVIPIRKPNKRKDIAQPQAKKS